MNNLNENNIYTSGFMKNEMGIYEPPKSLYHYSSIESMALMLKNNSLRFTRLDTLNGVDESYAHNLPFANTAVFTSNWTSHSEESIPLWKMYTQNMEGVRIELPVNMFIHRELPEVSAKGGFITPQKEAISIGRKGINLSYGSTKLQGPNKIHYSDEERFMHLGVLDKSDEKIAFNLYDLGLFKKKCWEFEQEWRFKIFAFPPEFELTDDPYFSALANPEKYPIEVSYVDFPLEPGIFNEAEFTLGPNATEAQYLILESLIEKYAPKAKVKCSNLTVK